MLGIQANETEDPFVVGKNVYNQLTNLSLGKATNIKKIRDLKFQGTVPECDRLNILCNREQIQKYKKTIDVLSENKKTLLKRYRKWISLGGHGFNRKPSLHEDINMTIRFNLDKLNKLNWSLMASR